MSKEPELSTWDIARVSYEARRAVLLSTRDIGSGMGIPVHWEKLNDISHYDIGVRRAKYVLDSTYSLVSRIPAMLFTDVVSQELRRVGVVWGPTPSLPMLDGQELFIAPPQIPGELPTSGDVESIAYAIRGATHPYAGDWEQLPPGERLSFEVFTETTLMLKKWWSGIDGSF